MKRRDFVRGGALAGLLGPLPLFSSPPSGISDAAAAEPPVGRARNVIFFAYDGLSFEDLAAARFFAARHDGGRRLALESLLGRGGAGLMLTHSLTSVVTDSSAASSAWATGRKITNGYVSMYPDGRPLTTILEVARSRGRATGLITTARMTHATPACWVARIRHRNLEDEIAAQYLEFAPEVLMGGGSVHFEASRRDDGRDLYADFRARGYEILRTPDDLARSSGSRLLGTFSADHLPYEIDRRFQHVPAPALADMVKRGLEVLSAAPGGFVLQIEAGRVDHANHQNDPAAMVWEILAGDRALEAVLAFVDANPDTVLIVASDHATGGGAVYGAGPSYSRSNEAFDRLALRRASQEHLFRRVSRSPSGPALQEAVRELFGVPLTADEADRGADAITRRLAIAHPGAHGRDVSNALHFLLTATGATAGDRLNFNYATGAHTAGPVPVAVYGAGTGTGGLGVVDNTQLFGWMTHALGAEFDNPVMTEEEALRAERSAGGELLALQEF
jgi:alkaline phosphatase